MDTVIFAVLFGMPSADAGEDTTVSINDEIRLHGSGADSLGEIVDWAWDIGNTGNFIRTSIMDTVITAPSTEDLNYQCVFLVIFAKKTIIYIFIDFYPY